MSELKSKTKGRQELSLRAWFVCFIAGLFWIGAVPLYAQEEAKKEETKAKPPGKVIEDEFLKLGTEKGIGGKDWMKFERSQIKFQIEQFIPPLLQSAFVGDAFVLPPNAIRFTGSSRFTNIDGGDFFLDHDPNRAVFRDFEVQRQFHDLDFFYGFDLNRKYLHSFTLRVNVPVINSRTNGFIHPNGQPFIDLRNSSSSLEFGDIGIFVKKKIFDQATFPFGVAVAGAVFLPTGANDKKFGNGGRILATRPDGPPGAPDNQEISFTQLMKNNVASGDWGVPQCFFENFNAANSALCPTGPFKAPASFVLGTVDPSSSFFGQRFTGEFPFNNGIFGRFSPDGRLPAVLQPGTGSFSYGLGLFFTRQFLPEDFLFSAEGALPHSFKDLERFPGRSAFHIGAFHRFNFEDDGIDPGDRTTFFASFVKPFYRDYLALDLSFVGFLQQEDDYKGKIPEPVIVAGPDGVLGTADDLFEFELIDRPPFSKGFTGLLAPSLIYSPDPQMRFTMSGLFRVVEPELGPAPPWVVRFGVTFTF
ncbi:MAG: hypothetical protein ACE5JU_12080 [Candidatus Binatia bacterium]